MQRDIRTSFDAKLLPCIYDQNIHKDYLRVASDGIFVSVESRLLSPTVYGLALSLC